MNAIQPQQTTEPRDGRKPYGQPKLVTHGKVEDVTQVSPPGSSQPTVTPH